MVAPALAQSGPVPISGEEFDCLINAAEKVELGAPIAGLLDSVAVTRGDRVAAGQLIAELSSDVERANAELARVRADSDVQRLSAEAQVEMTGKRLARLTELGASRLIPEKDLEEAVADAAVAVQGVREAAVNHAIALAELRRAEAQLAQRRIFSPIDGVVVERHLSPGTYVNDQAKIVTLAGIDTLHVEVYVPVAFYGQIALGNTVQVLPDAPLGGNHAATVTIVDPVIDAASGTFGVRLLLPNSGWALPAGLRCRALFGDPAEVVKPADLQPAAETAGN